MKFPSFFLTTCVLATMLACSSGENSARSLATYYDTSGRTDVLTGGVQLIDITTPVGAFKVWTKRVGNNPRIKVLLLHGGPGATHELWECMDSYFPSEGIEYYYYDQLGSYYSDQPSDTTLWTIERFVDEVEQVRQALGLDEDNFFLLGQSWGGILAMEYAFEHQQHLKGLIISNMVASAPDYNQYAMEVLGPQMPVVVYEEIMAFENAEDFSNPRYLELVAQHYYTEHVLRLPLEEWPDPMNRAFKHLNPEVYVYMQGPSEFGIKGGATLTNWDVKDRLKEITVPTLTIGATHDTMDPEHMEWMASEVQHGRFLFCPNGSHASQFDDQEMYMNGVIQFLKDVDGGNF
jgi:proline iminopeptidase